jgi:hypothetical protein
MPSSAGVFGVLAMVGDEPADEAGITCWVFIVGCGNALATLEVADLIFAAAILRGGDGGEDEEGEGEGERKVSSRFARLMEYQHLDFGGKTLTSYQVDSSV